jgi:uncharacterized protein (TIGR01777 family)
VRVAVAGSSGFIGSALVGALEESGYEIVRLVRPGTEPGRDGVRWDPAKGEVDEAALRRGGGLDAVINLAGVGVADRRWSAQYRERVLDSRVNSTRTLAQVLEAAGGVARVLNASAIGIYGSRGDEVLTEESSLGDDFLAHVCRRWEDEANALRSSATTVVTLRTGLVMDGAGGLLGRVRPLFRAGLGGRLGSGRQWMSLISRRDEVRAIQFLLESTLEGPVNLVAPGACTNTEFTRTLARALHRPALAIVPAPALRLALGAEMAALTVLASQRVAPRVLVESGFRFESADSSAVIATALA